MDHVTTRTTSALHMSCADGTERSLATGIVYDTRDPYTLAFVFTVGSQQVRWAIGRDLVAAGLLAPTGDGDVVVRPAEDDATRVEFRLADHGRVSTLSAALLDVAEFVDRTFEVVPMGEESRWMDLDGEIEKLLSAIE
ncbi:SsgA family sporulation/cell division regulator [Lentzea aerocolonigenes]|uniref:SsgA family sporulation/cell division regulator n=1 Tax=Lentzea aerocolonigenes TaxID=68170 RepID=UPI000B1F6A3B|nr:SsgA family sporulation/cell division regulator [Lentzea aerocolonigenes]